MKRHLGLDDDPSWIMVAEGNEFLWPGYDFASCRTATATIMAFFRRDSSIRCSTPSPDGTEPTGAASRRANERLRRYAASRCRTAAPIIAAPFSAIMIVCALGGRGGEDLAGQAPAADDRAPVGFLRQVARVDRRRIAGAGSIWLRHSRATGAASARCRR